MARFESFVTKELRPVEERIRNGLLASRQDQSHTYLKDIPYCDTASYPDFHTRVTSHALVAWSLQERKADTALPPTMIYFLSLSAMTVLSHLGTKFSGKG